MGDPPADQLRVQCLAMKRMWPFVLVGLVCLVVGAGLNETRHSLLKRKSEVKDRDTHELFQHRLRCKSVADDYIKADSDDSSTLFPDRVDYSSSRHSCIATFIRYTTGKRKVQHCNCFIETHDYETVDLLSGETLFSDFCEENDSESRWFCGNGRDMKLNEERGKALESALTSKE